MNGSTVFVIHMLGLVCTEREKSAEAPSVVSYLATKTNTALYSTRSILASVYLIISVKYSKLCYYILDRVLISSNLQVFHKSFGYCCR